MEDFKISSTSGHIYINGTSEYQKQLGSQFKNGEENKENHFFHNKNGELFFKTTKIGQINKTNLLQKIKNCFGGRTWTKSIPKCRRETFRDV